MNPTNAPQPKQTLGAALKQLNGVDMKLSIMQMQVESAKLSAVAAQTAEKARALLAAAVRSADAIQTLHPALLSTARGF